MTKEQSAAFEKFYLENYHVDLTRGGTEMKEFNYMDSLVVDRLKVWQAALSIAERKPDAVYSGLVVVGIHTSLCGQTITPEYYDEFNNFFRHIASMQKEKLKGRLEFYKQDAGAGEDNG